MTREDFVKAYAGRSNLSAEYAALGIIDTDGRTYCALPCACGEESCEGWAMVSASGVDSHLMFSAPDKLRVAYHEALKR